MIVISFTMMDLPEFKHSIVLFTGDDGIPLEFNIRNTKDKDYLRGLIEHGGGFCSQNESAVHLISPGAKVLNADIGKKLVSSSYVFDCVKDNYLLDVNDYVFVINEAQTSDISDEDSDRALAMRHSTGKSPTKNPSEAIDIAISPIKASVKTNESGSTTTSNLTLSSNNTGLPQISTSSSTNSESFVEGTQEVSSVYKISSNVFTLNEMENVCKSPKVVKSAEKLKEWELTDFQSINSPSLVSPVQSSHTEKEMSLCSPIRATSEHSSSSSSCVRKLPLKSNFNFEPSPKKSVHFDKITSEVPENDNLSGRKDIFLQPFLKSPKQYANQERHTLTKAISMEIDESITNADHDDAVSLLQSIHKSPLILTDKYENISREVCDESKHRSSNVKNATVMPSPFPSAAKSRNLTHYFEVQENLDRTSRSPIKKAGMSPFKPLSHQEVVMSPFKQASNKEVMSPYKQAPNQEAMMSPRKRASPLVFLVSPSKRNPKSLANATPSLKQTQNQEVVMSPRTQASPLIVSVSPSKGNAKSSSNVSPTPFVSSSQPGDDDLDNFDNMLLSKVQKKCEKEEDEDSLSQSYTVSSSADAQVSSLPGSAEANPPTENNSAPLPDSPSLENTELNVNVYLKNLENEVEEILRGTRPLSIQDKSTLVKYVCLAKRLSPADVLGSLFTDSLDL